MGYVVLAGVYCDDVSKRRSGGYISLHVRRSRASAIAETWSHSHRKRAIYPSGFAKRSKDDF